MIEHDRHPKHPTPTRASLARSALARSALARSALARFPLARSPLARLVLALYPDPVRERYGEEIADLLAHSTRPWRDLADVGLAALGERVTAVTWREVRHQTGPQLRRMAWLAAAPFGFGFVALVVSLLPNTVFAVFESYGHAPGEHLVDVVTALCGVPAIAGAGWLGRRLGRRRHLAAPVVTAPVGLAVGMILIMALTLEGVPLAAPGFSPGVAAAAAWCVAVVPVALVVGGLRARRYTGIAVVVALTGGLAVAGLADAAGAVAAGRGVASALVAWPVGLGLSWGLPVLLTTCTAFALALVHAHAGGRADHLLAGRHPEAVTAP